jgi:hypothetical protein
MTLGVLGVLAYCASMFSHEALGHGLACVARGGHNTMLTLWGEDCSVSSPIITAAGPIIQFAGGVLAWLGLRGPSATGSLTLRVLVWLYMTYGLLISTGYVAFSAVTDFGDAAELIAGLAPAAAWRALLFIIGAVGYYLCLWASARELHRLIDARGSDQRLRRLVWPPYLAAGVLACGAGLLNKTLPPHQGLGLAAVSSFGAGFGMVRLIHLRVAVSERLQPSAQGHVTRSAAWLIAAAVVDLFFVFVLGPGLQVHPR